MLIYALIGSVTRLGNAHQMILMGLGGNLAPPGFASPQTGLRAALDRLTAESVRTLRLSRWYRTAPVPAMDAPWFFNAVAVIETELTPAMLLARMLAVEVSLGRQRTAGEISRTVDLDLLAYDDEVGDWAAANERPALTLPHPRLADRAFVLAPLADVAPDWRHPVSRRTVSEMLLALPDRDGVEPLAE